MECARVHPRAVQNNEKSLVLSLFLSLSLSHSSITVSKTSNRDREELLKNQKQKEVSYSKSSKRKREGVIQNPATEKEEVFKIQQQRKRSYSKSSKRKSEGKREMAGEERAQSCMMTSESSESHLNSQTSCVIHGVEYSIPSVDHLIVHFKASFCPLKERCTAHKTCMYLHATDGDDGTDDGSWKRRRDLRTFAYTFRMCTNLKKRGFCENGSKCKFSHSKWESCLHPDRFRCALCPKMSKDREPKRRFCHAHERFLCPYAHDDEEIRVAGDADDWRRSQKTNTLSRFGVAVLFGLKTECSPRVTVVHDVKLKVDSFRLMSLDEFTMHRVMEMPLAFGTYDVHRHSTCTATGSHEGEDDEDDEKKIDASIEEDDDNDTTECNRLRDENTNNNWRSFWDEEYQRHYYHNATTGETTWTLPNLELSSSSMKDHEDEDVNQMREEQQLKESERERDEDDDDDEEFTEDAQHDKRSDDESGLSPFWHKRYELFSLFDLGVRLFEVEDAWFSTTPEVIAMHQAKKLIRMRQDADMRCPSTTSIDATHAISTENTSLSRDLRGLDLFCGVGGNSMSLASLPSVAHLDAVDINSAAIDSLRTNAEIYGVAAKLTTHQKDAMSFLDSCASRGETFDFLFASPPWGGPEYKDKMDFDLDAMPLSTDPQVAISFASLIERYATLISPFSSTITVCAHLVTPTALPISNSGSLRTDASNDTRVYCIASHLIPCAVIAR